MLSGAIRPERRTIVAAAALMISWQACESLVPVAIGAAVARAIEPGDRRALAVMLVLLALLFCVLSLSFRFGWRLSQAAAERTAHRVRVDVAEAALDPLRAPQRGRSTGTLVSIASSDADNVGQVAALVPVLSGAIVSIVVAAGALFLISVPLGVLVVVVAPPLLLGLHLLGGPLERRAAAEQARAADAVTVAADVLTGIRVLKGFGGERAASARYRIVSRRARDATVRAATADGAYEGATVLLAMGFLALVSLVAGWYAADGRIGVGQLVAAVGLAQFLLGPLGQIAGVSAGLARARASARRVETVLHVPRRTATARPSGPVRGGLDVAHPVSLEARPGELLGIAADTAGSHALVSMLADARNDPNTPVTVDGLVPALVEPAAAREVLIALRHDGALFSAPAIDNVRAVGADEVRVAAALRAADADEVLSALPEGGATVLADRGGSLSGGQRQRLALARALAADPAVLVLHDPTTALDSATEARVAAGIRATRAGRTTVLVATSPGLLAVCDRVLLVRDGRVVAEGTHAELTADPDYRELVLA